MLILNRLLIVLPLSLPLLLLADSAPSAMPPQSPMEMGRSYTAKFYAGESDFLWSRFSPEMQKVLGSAANFSAFRQSADGQLGKEIAIVSESVEPYPGGQVYKRVARFEKFGGEILVQWSLDAAGTITGFFIKPAGGMAHEAPSKYLDYQTKARLRLPFNGEWFVFWGGRTVAQNYHAAVADQRFAYDILMMKNGVSHTGEGKKNEDYYCFGQPILAPAAGKVIEAIDGIEDNVPGEMNPKQLAGNHLIIDFGNGEYALLAHFRKGSLKVKAGDAVKSGQPLGLTGNSGNSSEPHLHFHLQDGPVFGQAEGLPAFITNYLADGKPVARGEPVKGQVIRNP